MTLSPPVKGKQSSFATCDLSAFRRRLHRELEALEITLCLRASLSRCDRVVILLKTEHSLEDLESESVWSFSLAELVLSARGLTGRIEKHLAISAVYGADQHALDFEVRRTVNSSSS